MLRGRRIVLLLLHMAACLAAVHSQGVRTVDTQQPIIRSVPPDQDDYAYFGYSVVLHQMSPNTGSTSMVEALSNTRIIVGAPNGTAMNSAVDNTGLIYQCPILMGSSCSGLTGNNQGADARLFDSEANGNLEDKSGQFMGVSLASKGDSFIACAHRYLNFQGTAADSTRNPYGRCFFSGRDLSGFTEYQPCNGVGSRGTFSVGVCQAGASAALASTTDGTIGLAVGAPGVYTWRGIVIRRDPATALTDYEAFGEGTARFGYQGYSMTTGRFIQSDREDFAVSVPRLNMYFGAVNIVLNTEDLSVVSQPLVGRQMGEYYGFSLVAVDLTGDNIDEILVGAPQYRHAGTSPETGRVYVYSNTGGSLREFSQLIGFEAYSRFGYAMAALGDVSGDGLDDVAISAPFGAGSGTVYVYHSSASQLLNPVPQQTIVGSLLPVSPTSIIAGLKGFGTSLASGVDVDNNSYNDLVIGSFRSQQVFLLRTRPLAEVTTTMSANPNVINLDLVTNRCDFQGTDFTCFNVTACASYSGRGVSSSLSLTFTLTAERQRLEQGLEQRLFFNNPMGDTPGMFPNSTSRTEDANANVQNCQVFRVYVQQDISDRFNAFTVDLDVSTAELNLSPQDGNRMPVDFSGFPIVSAAGAQALQVEIFQDCGGQTCIPDLRLTVGNVNYESAVSGQTATRLTAGLVSSFTVPFAINNDGLDAFLAQLSFALPTRLLEFVRVEPRDVFVTCPVTEEFTQDNTAYTRHNCSIGNPFRESAMLAFSLRLSPRDGLTGGEGNIVINYELTSLNPENSTTRGNNAGSTTHPVDARADIFLDVPGFVSPEQVSYTSIVPAAPIVNASQLGPVFVTSFVVRNSGPSTIPNVRLVINWPLGSETGDNVYLYPAQIRSTSSGGSVTCQNRFINTEQLLLGPSEENFDNSEGGAGGSPGASVGGRRRRRSVPRSVRRKRQMQPTETVEDARDRTLSCIEGQISDGLMCAAIECNIFQLPGIPTGSAEVTVEAYLDERYFSGQVDTFNFIPTARVSISPEITFITEPETGTSNTSSAQVRVIPATAPLTTTPTSVPWYAIAIPIIVAVLFIAAVAGVLWGFGFFRRKKHEELKQRREELQALDSSTANTVDTVQ